MVVIFRFKRVMQGPIGGLAKPYFDVPNFCFDWSVVGRQSSVGVCTSSGSVCRSGRTLSLVVHLFGK